MRTVRSLAASRAKPLAMVWTTWFFSASASALASCTAFSCVLHRGVDGVGRDPERAGQAPGQDVAIIDPAHDGIDRRRRFAQERIAAVDGVVDGVLHVRARPIAAQADDARFEIAFRNAAASRLDALERGAIGGRLSGAREVTKRPAPRALRRRRAPARAGRTLPLQSRRPPAPARRRARVAASIQSKGKNELLIGDFLGG